MSPSIARATLAWRTSPKSWGRDEKNRKATHTGYERHGWWVCE